jgi:ABC-type glycerol-3-phosphate transport system substrate-binding protein
MRWRRLFQGIAVAAVAMLFASACLSESGGGGGGGESTETAAGDKQIEIMYGFGGDQSKGFEGAMAEFQRSSGITVKFVDASRPSTP